MFETYAVKQRREQSRAERYAEILRENQEQVGEIMSQIDDLEINLRDYDDSDIDKARECLRAGVKFLSFFYHR